MRWKSQVCLKSVQNRTCPNPWLSFSKRSLHTMQLFCQFGLLRIQLEFLILLFAPLCKGKLFDKKSNFCVLKMWHMTDIQKGKDVWVEIVWGVSRIVVHWVKGGSDKTLTIIDNNEMTLLGNLASQPLQFMTELLMDLVPASHRTFLDGWTDLKL